MQFLRNHPKVFEVKNERVRLIEQYELMDTDDTEFYSMDYQTSDVDIQNEHWFCFDDSTVTCVTRASIEKHFGLSDCAYMLFYRQKNRPETTTRNSIPAWLLEEIADKNRTLEEKRFVERSMNRIA